MSEGYKLYGGTGVEIEPLEVSEDGTYTAPMGKAFNPVKVSGGGSTGGGVLVVNVDTENWVLDKTWQEIADAPIAVIKDSYELGDTSAIVLDTWIDDEKTEDAYQVTALRSQRGASPETLRYFCNGANEYPIVD